MKKKIKKQWCTYGSMWPIGFGKIMEEHDRCVFIRYYHDQLYENSCWDKNYVKRFDTLEEAAYKYKDYFNNYTDLRMDHPYSDEEFNMLMKHNFPSYFKQKKEELRNSSSFSDDFDQDFFIDKLKHLSLMSITITAP